MTAQFQTPVLTRLALIASLVLTIPSSSSVCVSAQEVRGAGTSKPSQSRPRQRLTNAQKGWGLAASALLTEWNHQGHDTLAGVALTEENKRSAHDTLQEWWDVENRNDLLARLTWLEQGGHRRMFADVGGRVSPLEPARFQKLVAILNPEVANAVLVARRYYQKLGKQSIIGWDYARYISLCRFGYTAGYLSEDEAWLRIMNAARLIQRTFSSWQELGENYLIGRQFWSLDQTQKNGAAMRVTYRRLLDDANSPWRRIPWALDLK